MKKLWRRFRGEGKHKKKLLHKYTGILLVGILFFPLSFPLTTVFIYLPAEVLSDASLPYANLTDLEDTFHEEVDRLPSSPSQIEAFLKEWHKKYPDASLFWLNREGYLQQFFGAEPQNLIPGPWTPGDTVQFMKDNYDSDPFTIVAFIGESKNEGFAVFQVDRSLTETPLDNFTKKYGIYFYAFMFVFLAAFLFISWRFFRGIQKRLVQLEHGMHQLDDEGIPTPVLITKDDEIGALEHSFQEMVAQLKEDRRKQKEEEQLRKDLIAHLSHDLKTPLTALRGQLYQLQQEPQNEKSTHITTQMNQKIMHISQYMEQLLSYTLLSAGRYQFEPTTVDLQKKLRSFLAIWYPSFEKRGIQVKVDIPETPVRTRLDPSWLERIVDNCMSNILQHATGATTVTCILVTTENTWIVKFIDNGQGIKAESKTRGARVGLSIVSLMCERMNVTWSIDSIEGKGTVVTFSGDTFYP
ncbi:sensor histidine kinase [Bacillus fonticola]|uniref:sensor histidine kinase n=1 Tax=Bacillus fonticola TaxID=2728853 RepID=UPI001475CCEE|nr:HAMP domain-containing sensor histidine kinase [Bacillus fonticola]